MSFYMTVILFRDVKNETATNWLEETRGDLDFLHICSALLFVIYSPLILTVNNVY